jgi:hypothetical protein
MCLVSTWRRKRALIERRFKSAMSTSRPTAAVASADARAVAQCRMISPGEERIRKVVGAAVTTVALALLFACGADAAPFFAWHLLFAAGVVVFRMGVESQ